MSHFRATSWRGERDFMLEIAKGQVGGHDVLHKWGKNPDVGTAAWEHVWFDGGTYTWPIVADTVRIRAGGNVADTAAGAGARTVVVNGLDENWATVEDTLTLAGASASAESTKLFTRVNRAYVATCGTYGASNTGDVHVEHTTSGDILAHIDTELGQSQIAHYTVPANHTAFINSLRLGIFSTKTASVRFNIRTAANVFSAPVSPRRVISEWDGVQGQLQFVASPPYPFPAYTDIWISAKADGGAATTVLAEFDGVVVQMNGH